MGEPSNALRNSESTAMLDYGFAQYKTTSIIKKGDIVTEVEIESSKDKTAQIVTVEDASILMKKTQKLGEITYDISLNKLKAPLKVGDIVGKLKIKEDGKQIKEINLTVKENVEKANLLELYFRYLSDMIVGNIQF